jgi:DNA topoisomerase VI subunit B
VSPSTCPSPLVALTRAARRTAVHEGHPFIVEAAVAIGNNTKKKSIKPVRTRALAAPWRRGLTLRGGVALQGITVYRFANRIPLLFEPGSDVVSVVANKNIK